MGYDVDFVDENGELFELKIPHHVGGIQREGGMSRTYMSVTYNYYWFYKEFLDKRKGFEWLHGKLGKVVLPRIKKVVKYFDEKYNVTITNEQNYWVDSMNNCLLPLRELIRWCELYPEGRFNLIGE